MTESDEKRVWFVREDVKQSVILEGALREGWTLAQRLPRRGDSPAFWHWTLGQDEHFSFWDNVKFGLRRVAYSSARPAPDWLVASIEERSAKDLAERGRAATTPEEKIRTLSEAVMGLAPNLTEEVQALLVERMCDSVDAVRWMAAKALASLDDVMLDKVLGALLARETIPADVEARARHIQGLVQASLRGDYLDDLNLKDDDVLRDQMTQAFREKKWRRVEFAAARLLWKDMPLYETWAAAAWSAAMAAKGEVWRAFFAALVISEINTAEGKEGVAAAVRAEVEPKLASLSEPPKLEDIHPVLWLLRDSSKYPEALEGALQAIEAVVPNLQNERLLMRIIAARSRKDEARGLAKQLRERLPGAVTPHALLAYWHGWDEADDETLADFDALAAVMAKKELAARGKGEPQSPEEAAFDVWAEGILAYQARRPTDLIRGHLRVYQKRGDLEGALRAAERAVEADDSALAWMDKGMILTALKRHEEAIAAYGEAMKRIDKDGKILLGGNYDACWFNRACERAFLGDHDGALRDLAEAARRDKKWIESAKTDDYFDSIRADPRFQRILDGDLSAAPPEIRAPEPETPNEIETDEEPEPPEVLAARYRWVRIRGAVTSLREAGFGDAAIVDLFKEALRGNPPPVKAAKVEGVPAALSAFVQDTTTTDKGNLVMTIMALDTAASGGSLDESLENLEGIVISSIALAVAPSDKPAEAEEKPAEASNESALWEKDPFGNPYFDPEFNRRLYADEEGEDYDEEDEGYGEEEGEDYDEEDEGYGEEDDEDDADEDDADEDDADD